jgi:metal-responsive CopG/Arc/MetJ family transcriptional regulator
MRTTVEIPDPLYRRIKTLAAERGMRGFSPIVERALEDYLASQPAQRTHADKIEAAAGAWSDEDVAELEEAVRQAWSTSRIDR